MRSNGVVIRRAEIGDRAVLADLLRQLDAHYWGARESAEPMARAAAEAIVTGASGCAAIVAWIDDTPSAVATYTILHPGTSEHGSLFMKDLFVVDGARGTGIGRDVMAYLASLAVELGCQAVRLDCRNGQSGRIGVLRRAGRTADRPRRSISGLRAKIWRVSQSAPRRSERTRAVSQTDAQGRAGLKRSASRRFPPSPPIWLANLRWNGKKQS